LTIDSIGSVTTWRLIFLIEGIITAGVGIICYFIMTDRPATAKWLTEEEKGELPPRSAFRVASSDFDILPTELAIARIKTESIGATVVLDKMNKKGIFQGIFAPSTIIISIIFLLNNITVQGVAFFTPTIISSIYPKKTTVQKQLQTVPPYIVGAFFTVLVSTYLARKETFLVAHPS
jgi:hypothetical protein